MRQEPSAGRVASRYMEASASGFFSDYKNWTLPHLLGDRRYRSWWVDRKGKLLKMRDDPKNSSWGGKDVLLAANTILWKGDWEPNEVHFEFLNVHKEYRGHGVGSQILSKIIELADKNQVSLTLQPKNMGGNLSKGVLAQWYKRYGFEVLVDPDKGVQKDYLIRYPR